MIVGLTGKNGCGKGTVADILKKKDFVYHSLSDVIRDEIRRTGSAVTREKMIETGRRLRQEGGPGVLAEMILARIGENQDAIVDSVRNPGEVQVLRSRADFILVNVEADRKLRFERCRARARENDPVTLEEFIRLENAELESADRAAQQLLATAALADVVVENDGTLGELESQVAAFLGRCRRG